MFKVGMFKAHPPIPPLSERASRFIRSCFEPDPVRRPTATQLLQDIFIQQYVHHSNRSGSMNKKHIDGKNREIQRSSSHMSGMGLSTMNAAAKETLTVKETSTSQTHINNGKKARRSTRQRNAGEKLHLLISQAPDASNDNSNNRSISPCTFHLSQPSSPYILGHTQALREECALITSITTPSMSHAESGPQRVGEARPSPK
uniref:Protein kinase domain-containing protein n=1 Tax=Steinernema glaseri TaxID=37863 RepID=A0A1I7ZQH4_9BILA